MAGSKILIVDGDATVAIVTQHGLQRLFSADSTIEIALSPADAWQRCLAGTVDLLIIDPSPENSAAAALVQSLCTNCPNVLLFILTAYDTPWVRKRMQSLGVHYYLAKPVALSDLSQLVGVALAADRANRYMQS